MVILNMFILNYIFDGFWWEYLSPIQSMLLKYNTWKNETSMLFPKLARCEYQYFGPSASIQHKDALCILALNILNEKIFAFIYIWYVMLLIVAFLNVAYRCICLVSRSFRIRVLHSMALKLTRLDIQEASNNGSVAEWFFLYQLGRNMHPLAFYDIISELADTKKTLHLQI